jgi:hypothetical protein
MGVLQGTFDTLSLTEVLGLLAQSHKTGALWLEAGSVQGRVYLADGRCCAAESVELTDAVTTERDLATRLVDVCFTLARQHDGAFRFVADEQPNWRVAGGVAVDDAVDALDRLLAEWREIQAVIPSLDVRPTLATELGNDSIVVDQAGWRLLVCLDGRRSVRDVMRHTQRSVLDVCNALKQLVEEGAVEIAPEMPPAIPQPAAAVAMPDPFAVALDEVVEAVEAIEAIEPEVEALPEPEPEADTRAEPAHAQHDAAPRAAAVEEDDNGRDRGAMLRLFSALRDT